MSLLRSLRSRIYALAALFGAAALSLGVLLFQTSGESRDALRWVSHTQEVIIGLDALIGSLREAESGLRGYLLTSKAEYLTPVDNDLLRATVRAADIRRLVTDNPEQQARAARLQDLVELRVSRMRSALARADAHTLALGGTADPVRIAQAKQLMDQVTTLAASMRTGEHALLAERTATVENNAERARLILFLGWPVLVIMIIGAVWLILVSINRPLDDLLGVVKRFGAGDRTARASPIGHSIELQVLANAYNQMADGLVTAMESQAGAEREIARANAELVARSRALETRNQSNALVSGMSQRLQAIRSDQELGEVLNVFLPQVLPELAGSLYILNSSRNLLTRTSSWGEPQAKPDAITPDSCWALRRGKEHVVDRPGTDLVCQHAHGTNPIEQYCKPVLAGGDVLGLLYIEGPMDEEARFRLGLLSENIALALVNEALRKRLREQSIRDPLTGLFNRRYMEEALALETARSSRSGSPLAIVMTDVDHFKTFNDQHGHEAGDALLRAVGRLIQSEFRNGDIVCRFGGEEFIIIAPDTALEVICARADTLRMAVRELTVDFRGQRIGPVTMSFGVSVWSEGRVGLPEDLINRADQALYRAKRLGRDRIEMDIPDLQAAAE
jgi:diguanylate cyclase (GGDEF)-like protein